MSILPRKFSKKPKKHPSPCCVIKWKAIVSIPITMLTTRVNIGYSALMVMMSRYNFMRMA